MLMVTPLVFMHYTKEQEVAMAICLQQLSWMKIRTITLRLVSAHGPTTVTISWHAM